MGFFFLEKLCALFVFNVIGDCLEKCQSSVIVVGSRIPLSPRNEEKPMEAIMKMGYNYTCIQLNSTVKCSTICRHSVKKMPLCVWIFFFFSFVNVCVCVIFGLWCACGYIDEKRQ